jgi:uncharacterized membrane protein YphA (DoxX/SURF4 family)
MDFLTSPYFLLFARLCVGGVFVVSAIGKLLDKSGTEASMARYPFLPGGAGKLIANYFPFVELLVGLMLVFGVFTRLAAVAAIALFVLFTTLIVYDLTRGSNASCHCFGRLSNEKLTPMAVVRNVALMALALLVALSFDGWLALDAALNTQTGGNLGLVVSDGAGAFPTFVDAVPIMLLALVTVGVVVLGGRAVSVVRTVVDGLGFR